MKKQLLEYEQEGIGHDVCCLVILYLLQKVIVLTKWGIFTVY